MKTWEVRIGLLDFCWVGNLWREPLLFFFLRAELSKICFPSSRGIKTVSYLKKKQSFTFDLKAMIMF